MFSREVIRFMDALHLAIRTSSGVAELITLARCVDFVVELIFDVKENLSLALNCWVKLYYIHSLNTKLQ